MMKLIHLVILLLAVYKGNNNRDSEAFLVATTPESVLVFTF